MFWVVPFFCCFSHLTGRADSLFTLAGRVRGRVVLSPWLAEGVGRETRAKMAVRARKSILHFTFQY